MSDHLPPELEREVRGAVNMLEKAFACHMQALTQRACGHLPSLYAIEQLCTRYGVAIEQQRDRVRATIYETMKRD